MADVPRRGRAVSPTHRRHGSTDPWADPLSWFRRRWPTNSHESARMDGGRDSAPPALWVQSLQPPPSPGSEGANPEFHMPLLSEASGIRHIDTGSREMPTEHTEYTDGIPLSVSSVSSVGQMPDVKSQGTSAKSRRTSTRPQGKYQIPNAKSQGFRVFGGLRSGRFYSAGGATSAMLWTSM